VYSYHENNVKIYHYIYLEAIQKGFKSRGQAMGSIPRFLMAHFAQDYPVIANCHKYSTTNFGALNRLDRETSGCAIIGLHEKIVKILEQQRN